VPIPSPTALKPRTPASAAMATNCLSFSRCPGLICVGLWCPIMDTLGRLSVDLAGKLLAVIDKLCSAPAPGRRPVADLRRLRLSNQNRVRRHPRRSVRCDCSGDNARAAQGGRICRSRPAGPAAVIRMPDITFPAPESHVPGYLAVPDGQGPWPGVVVVQDVLGMTADLRRITDRLAASGYLAMAPALYGRRPKI